MLIATPLPMPNWKIATSGNTRNFPPPLQLHPSSTSSFLTIHTSYTHIPVIYDAVYSPSTSQGFSYGIIASAQSKSMIPCRSERIES